MKKYVKCFSNQTECVVWKNGFCLAGKHKTNSEKEDGTCRFCTTREQVEEIERQLGLFGG